MTCGVLIEIEELLFDTLPVRVRALTQALSAEGVQVPAGTVEQAHRGASASMALHDIGAARGLDATSRELALRRAADLAGDAFRTTPPLCLDGAQAAMEMLARAIRIGVVTRASRAEAMAWIEAAGMAPCVTAIRSLGDGDEHEHPSVWHDAVRGLHATRGIAVVPSPLVGGARRAGLLTVAVGSDRPLAHADHHVTRLADLDSDLITRLCTMGARHD